MSWKFIWISDSWKPLGKIQQSQTLRGRCTSSALCRQCSEYLNFSWYFPAFLIDWKWKLKGVLGREWKTFSVTLWDTGLLWREKLLDIWLLLNPEKRPPKGSFIRTRGLSYTSTSVKSYGPAMLTGELAHVKQSSSCKLHSLARSEI